MIKYTGSYEYIESCGNKLFTAILLPDKTGKFPVVIMRNPYVNAFEDAKEDDIVLEYLNEYKPWLENGYAIVFQHCRGRGKSDGDCIPYINEHEDGIALQEWVRKQDFYNGEIYFTGGSYMTSVHYATAPFADDIKGAVFNVQDCERYNICYCNGFFKKALHGSWYLTMYKAKEHRKFNYTFGAFDMLPLSDFTKTVFEEEVEDLDQLLKAPNPDNEFWNTRAGGSDARQTVDSIKFPVLFTTSFYDIYTGGMFDMWNKLPDDVKKISAFVVSPYHHGDDFDAVNSIHFPSGKRKEKFGEFYQIEWLNFVRGKREKSPFELGKITYYNLFKNCWEVTKDLSAADKMTISLGSEEVSYVYNPFDAPRFKGGLSRAFGGSVYQDKPNSRYDIISIYTEPVEEETVVKGKMSAKLKVKSDCEDTCFYVRVSIEKENGYFGLRDDITSLCYQLGDYKPDSVTELDFNFDEHAFTIKKGERLRVDIASADNDHYVRHTNQKGLFSEQTTAKIAHNTVLLQDSFLTLPIEK